MTPERFLRLVTRFRIDLHPPARAVPTKGTKRQIRKQKKKLGGSIQWFASISVNPYSKHYENRKRFFGWGKTPEEAVQQVVENFLNPKHENWGPKGRRVISLDFSQG